MTTSDDFEVKDLQFQTSEEGEKVRLIFTRNSGERQEVVFRRRDLASLVAGAQKLLSPSDAVPIDRESLRSGTTIQVTGYQFSPGGAELCLTLFVDLPDQGRGVTIPLCFSRKNVESMMGDMGYWLQRPNA